MSSEVIYDYPHEPQRTAKPVRSPRFPVIGLAGALLCVFVFYLHNRSRDSFLVGAARVHNADDIRIVGWMSDRELLALSPRFPSEEAVVLNVVTGERTRLSGLSAALFSKESDEPLFRPRMVLSPDRKWVLYVAFGGRVGPRPGPRIDAVAIDGSKRVSWHNRPHPGDRAGFLGWSSDSTRWYRLRRLDENWTSPTVQVFEYRLDDPTFESTRRFSGPDFRPRATVNGKLISSDYFWGDEPPLDRAPAFRTLDLDQKKLEVTRVPLALPEKTSGYSLLPAASEDLVVVDSWTSGADAEPKWGKWLGVGDGEGSRVHHTVQAFDPTGKKLFDIGRIRTKFDDMTGDNLRMMSCSPSGRRILFRLNESFYVKDLDASQ